MLVTFLAHAAFLGLPWRQDDVVVIPDAVEHVGFVATALVTTAIRGEVPTPIGPERLDWLFQPVPGLVWAVAGGVQGADWRPWPFRLVSLISQGLVVVLAYRLFRKFLTPASATLASAVVAIDATGFQAVSWVAAMPDLLLTLLTLTAVHCQFRADRRRYAILSAICVALMPWTKATGFLVAPFFVVLCFAPHYGSWSRRWWSFGFHAFGLALTTLVRAAYLGYYFPRYAEGASLSSASTSLLWDMSWPYLQQLIAPWGLSPDAQGTWPLLAEIAGGGAIRPWIVLVWILVAAAAFIGSQMIRRRATLAIAALLVLAVPAIWIFHHPDTFNASSRASHLAQIPLALLIGCGFENLRRQVTRPWVATLLLTIIILPLMDASISNIRQELRSGELGAIRVAAVERAAAATPGAAVAVIDPQPEQATIGFAVMPQRFQSPFRSSSLRVASFPTEADLLSSPWLAETEQPIRLARWSSGDIAVDSITIGGKGSTIPQLNLAGIEEGYSRFRPQSPITPRSAAGLLVALGARETTTIVTLRVVTDGTASTYSFPVDAGEAVDVPTSLEHDARWMLAGKLTEVCVAPVGALVSLLPLNHANLQIRSPRDGDRVMASAPWKFDLRGIPPIATRLETKIEFLILGRPTALLGNTPIASAVASVSSTLSWQPTSSTSWSCDFTGLRPDTLEPLMRLHLLPLGRREIQARVRFTARFGDGNTVVARSDPMALTFFLP